MPSYGEQLEQTPRANLRLQQIDFLRPQARLAVPYRATDRLSRGGAPVENLAQSASFHSRDKNAPSRPWIKHPARRGDRPGEGRTATCPTI
jgi:hypothetical protein